MPHPIRCLILALPLALLPGCAMENTALPSQITGTPISGVAFGGQVAITGAKVYLLAANPAGYGSASLSLLTSASTGSTVDSIGAYATTLAGTGGFNLAGDYDCTVGYTLGAGTSSGGTTLRGDEQVYLYVLGGSSSGTANRNSGLLAALGPCNGIYSTKITLNELTTVAAAYAFAGYFTDATHLSSSGTLLARTGLANAGLNSANLVDISTGLPVANSTGITRPVATLYTLADILAACINGVSNNSGCTTLFTYTNSAGTTGTAVTDTATAAINLAHNPWPTAGGMSALFGLAPATGAPFTAGLSSQPNDFTLSLTYAECAIDSVTGVAIDASGNAWTADYGTSLVVKISGTGACTEYSGGVYEPLTIAIDASGDAWGATFKPSLFELASNGTPVSGSAGYTNSNLVEPVGIAFDASGNVWIADAGSSISFLMEFSSGGSLTTTYGGGGIHAPAAVAINAANDVWTANYAGDSVSEITASGTALSPTNGYTGGGISKPHSIAIDSNGYAWTANYGSNSVSKVGINCVRLGDCSTGAISPSAGYTGGGINTPYSIAIDGSNNIWVANYAASVSELSNAGTAISPATGYASGMYYAEAVAIDGSGDVWLGTEYSVIELIGAATPVVTPIVANLLSPYGTPASKP